MLKNILGLLSSSPKEIMDAAEKELSRIGYEVVREEDDLFLFAIPPQFFGEGSELPPNPGIVPLLCSHVDVVGEVVPKLEDLIVDKSENRISLSPKSEASVLGADDRAGIYALFQIVGSLHNKMPFVVLTDHEEIGGIGAQALVSADFLEAYKEHISCYIELDRKGCGEMVSYDAMGEPNEEFGNLFLEQGFILRSGSYSDVSDFTAATQTSNINLSVGYRNEHTKREVLFLDELNMTVSRVLEVWKNSSGLFDKVYQQIEDVFGESFYHQGYDMNYDLLMEEIDGLTVDVEETEIEEAEIVFLVQAFLDNLSPKLLDTLLLNLPDVASEVYAGSISDSLVADALIHLLSGPADSLTSGRGSSFTHENYLDAFDNCGEPTLSKDLLQVGCF